MKLTCNLLTLVSVVLATSIPPSTSAAAAGGASSVSKQLDDDLKLICKALGLNRLPEFAAVNQKKAAPWVTDELLGKIVDACVDLNLSNKKLAALPVDGLSLMRKMKSLNLSGNDSLKVSAEDAGRLDTLELLEKISILSSKPNIETINGLLRLKSLRHLDLASSTLTRLNELATSSTLEILKLNKCNLKLEELALILKSFPRLKVLDCTNNSNAFAYTRPTDLGDARFPDSLEELHLGNCKIMPIWFRHILDNTNVSRLMVPDNELLGSFLDNDPGSFSFGAMRGRLTHLNMEATNAPFKVIPALLECPKLVDVNLSTNIKLWTKQDPAVSLSDLKNLTDLHLHMTEMNPDRLPDVLSLKGLKLLTLSCNSLALQILIDRMEDRKELKELILHTEGAIDPAKMDELKKKLVSTSVSFRIPLLSDYD